MKKRALVTGVNGQDGAYLAKFLLGKDYEVYGFATRRVNQRFDNLDWLGITDQINIIYGDITDSSSITNAILESRPDEIYNLAAMSFVGYSWKEPIHTANVDGMGALYLLESVRINSPTTKIYQASTSEMYGNNWENNFTQNELTNFRPRSPYGSAKTFAHNTMVNYRESFGLHTSCGILFNHESPIRGIEFVTRKITDGVAKIKNGLVDHITLGNLNTKRDWGFSGDYVEAMWMMLQNDPDDYVIATGEAHSLEDFLDRAFARVGINDWSKYVKTDKKYIRPAEVPHLLGDPKKANEKLGWKTNTSFDDLVNIMVDADLERYV